MNFVPPMQAAPTRFCGPATRKSKALSPLDRPVAEEVKQREWPRLADILGPGLVTGASDDDPSGIATYSQAGAQYGYGLIWTLLLTYPLMCAIQMISAEIGRVTGRGLAGNMRRHFPRAVLYLLVGLLMVANVINLGADLGAMGRRSGFSFPVPAGFMSGCSRS